MKTIVMIMSAFLCCNICLIAQPADDYCQNSDSLTKVHNVIWFTPAAASEINGLAIGLMPVPLSPYKHLTINGMNIEVGIIPTFQLAFAIPYLILAPFEFIDNIGKENANKKDTLLTSNTIPDTLNLRRTAQPLDSMNNKSTINEPFSESIIERPITSINGLNLSVGIIASCNITGAGINLLGTNMYKAKGFFLSGALSYSNNLQGVQISGLVNIARVGNGMQFSIFNSSDDFNGLQIGLVNLNQNGSGLMIGLFNGSNNFKGVQIGLLNRINNTLYPV